MTTRLKVKKIYPSYREKALTIYFDTADEKQAFVDLAKKFGMNSSTFGMLCLGAGLPEVKKGFDKLSGQMNLTSSFLKK